MLRHNFKATVREIYVEVLGFNERQILYEWYDGECAKATKIEK
jgi:hypothetical protein